LVFSLRNLRVLKAENNRIGFSGILRLTKGWKIEITSAVIAVIGWVLGGISIFTKWGDSNRFYFITACFVGRLIIGYGTNLIRKEKKQSQAMIKNTRATRKRTEFKEPSQTL